jgi:hypothetical protein
VLSQVVREPGVAIRDALLSYARFYERLLPYRAQVVVGEFEEVTHDFGSVIRRLNAHFGTSFAEFEHTESAVRECFDLIKQRGALSAAQLGFESGLVSLDDLRREQRAPGSTNTLVEAREAWVPSTERRRTTSALREQWERPSLRGPRQRADRVYRAFLAE